MASQMKKPDLVPSQSVGFGQLVCGFFRRSGNEGRVWFAGRSGNYVFCFPVLENGNVSKHSRPPEELYPSEEVHVLDRASLGIGHEVVWSDEEAV